MELRTTKVLHLSEEIKATNWLLYPHPIDGRKGINSLEQLIITERRRAADIGEQFIFFTKRRNMMKLLRRDTNGIGLTELRGDHLTRFVNDLQKRVADPEVRKMLEGIKKNFP